jgi:Cu-Zn family superoxide dismutase
MTNRPRKAVFAAAAAIAVASTAWAVSPVDAGDPPDAEGKAVLIDTSGVVRGRIEMGERNGTVRLNVRLAGATPGFHGFHVHSTGTCRNPDGTPNFALAGGHYGHDVANGIVHGRHPGDLPPLYVDASGNGTVVLNADQFSIADIAGRAFIVHAGPDNLANIPARYGVTIDDTTLSTGDAGARSYCGVIVQQY